MAKKAPKSDGIFLILPFVRDPSTSEREHVKTIFLHGDLKEEIYMEQPKGFVASGQEHIVC